MNCHWCRLPLDGTPAVSYPLLNGEPRVHVSLPGSGVVYVLHAPCWRKIKALEERKDA